MTRSWVAGISLALSAACSNLESPTPPQAGRLVVHAVLDAQAFRQPILIARARTGVSSVSGEGIGDDEPVFGAVVTMTAPNGAVAIGRPLIQPEGSCCVPGEYILDFDPATAGVLLTNGGKASLYVQTPAGEVVTGTTTIPGPSRLTTLPPAVFFKLRDTLRLSWPRVPGAAAYEVVVRSGGEYRTFTDTSIVLPGTALTIAGDDVFLFTSPTDIVVSAVDRNYYDYYRAQSDPFAGAAPSRLTGAVGVFGSIAPVLQLHMQVH
ncbi:MAG: hypothetical protein ACJ796_21665 [Gemmatimonadaceae bacterium]